MSFWEITGGHTVANQVLKIQWKTWYEHWIHRIYGGLTIHQTTWSASWEICMQVRKQQLESDMEQQTGSK